MENINQEVAKLSMGFSPNVDYIIESLTGKGGRPLYIESCAGNISNSFGGDLENNKEELSEFLKFKDMSFLEFLENSTKSSSFLIGLYKNLYSIEFNRIVKMRLSNKDINTVLTIINKENIEYVLNAIGDDDFTRDVMSYSENHFKTFIKSIENKKIRNPLVNVYNIRILSNYGNEVIGNHTTKVSKTDEDNTLYELLTNIYNLRHLVPFRNTFFTLNLQRTYFNNKNEHAITMSKPYMVVKCGDYFTVMPL